MASGEVLIIGAGLAGLSCARKLSSANVPFTLLEAEDEPGGRVRTELLGDFQLDRGFQVYQTAYPQASQTLDHSALDLRSFTPGVMVRRAGKFHRMIDPYRRPADLFGTMGAKVGGFMDKARVDMLRKRILNSSHE